MSDSMDKARGMLVDQIDKLNIDENQKSDLKKKIMNSSDDELRAMVSQSQSSSDSSSDGESQNCIFCSIVSGAVSSFKIADDDHALAVLEINPASRGHTIIIPKKHGKLLQMPDNIKSLLGAVSDKIQRKLNPKKIDTSKADLMGHTIFNVIPVYDNVPLEKKSASSEELEELQGLIVNEPISLDSKKEVIVISDDKPKRRSKKVVDKSVSVKSDDSNKVDVKEKSKKAKKLSYKAPFRIP